MERKGESLERQERESGVHFVKNKAVKLTICWFLKTPQNVVNVFFVRLIDVAPILLGLAFLVGVKMEKEKIRDSYLN